MGYVDYSENLYYSPEASNVDLIGTVQWGEASWDFDLTCVWRSKEDPTKFYVASDSGCSCPSPFENIELSELKPMTKHQALAALVQRGIEEDDEDWGSGSSADAAALIEKLVMLR
jgi:hypothetical protein